MTIASPVRADRDFHRVVWLTLALFLSYLCVGMSLPVTSVYVTTRLGFGNALAGLAVMPFLAPIGLLRWPFLFLWGGSLGGFYTLSLTLVGRRFGSAELPAANAAFVIVYEIGGMLGPMASGLGFDLWSPHGALVPLALAYAVFVAGALIVRDRKP